MDDDKLIKKISLDFFDMLYEDLTREQQSVVRKAVEEDKRRTSGVIKRPSAYAGGGMMNINRMTAPLGYKEAGEVGIRERIYNMLGPKDKISDEQLRLKGINPESVLPEERPVDPDQPEGVLQGLFGQLFGGRGAEGSELSPVEELKLLKLQLMLEKGMPGSTLMPSGDPDKIKRLENRIIELYTQLGE